MFHVKINILQRYFIYQPPLQKLKFRENRGVVKLIKKNRLCARIPKTENLQKQGGLLRAISHKIRLVVYPGTQLFSARGSVLKILEDLKNPANQISVKKKMIQPKTTMLHFSTTCISSLRCDDFEKVWNIINWKICKIRNFFQKCIDSNPKNCLMDENYVEIIFI